MLDVIQSTAGYFEKRKIESPRLNAEHLLAHVLGVKRLELYLAFERELTEAELAPLRELVRRRGTGEPLQHLLGTVEFCGHTFLCDKRALVPRPETEQLVEKVVSRMENGRSIADVGTGSGVIALSLAAKFPEARVTAIDISPEALALARQNAERIGSAERVTFVQGDLLPTDTEQYDVIVANLPYLAHSERESLAREVLHDPPQALFSGEKGDEIILRLVEQAPARLRPNGLLALELGLGQAEILAERLQQKGWHEISTEKDFQGMLRFIFARYG